MTDKRRVRSLKQARRDVRRAKKRNAADAAHDFWGYDDVG